MTTFAGLINQIYAHTVLLMFGTICSNKNVQVYGKDCSMVKYD